ncbi:PFGI-1 class ICE element type IV pilus protein PilL2 [Salinisphaera orenii]|uniref:PFGI-1 class ICE element type IV pilus protein PilL2 n=1 Tax=Salinisphaera orenii TaxID=856731 RepID=UPI0013A5F5D4
MTHITIYRPAVLSFLVPGLLLLTVGCATTHEPDAAAGSSRTHSSDVPHAADTPPAATRHTTRPERSHRPRAVRSSRYQLVKLSPQTGQRNLLKQTISIHLPNGMDLTVADGLEHVLTDSGLRLCQQATRGDRFDTPLPAVDRNLGPTTLGDALKVLAGPAWTLHTNFATRRVCFHRNGQQSSPDSGHTSGHAITETRHD